MSTSAVQAQVQSLCEQGLYDSAELLGSFLVSASKSSQPHFADSLALYADCLMGKQEYRRALVTAKRHYFSFHLLFGAQSFYKQAAQQRKLLVNQTSQARGARDAQLKYKECQCYIKLGEDR